MRASAVTPDAFEMSILAMKPYIIPITYLIANRYRKETIVFGPSTLRRWGMFVNIYSVVYGLFIIAFVPLPPRLPVTALNMNYCAPIFLGIALLLLLDWVVRGRTRFKVPLKGVLCRR
ncbi:hypothetical protein BJ878DRAFT_499486 [Calycina marina]|uniref:Uncharacterized protein n=1 Tax=Calycina marina TaxID=1763456 RepID=A0A9P8CG46_9HELO|nr:hypothetical protein BJ878DRAFT_499486 [Calycina marina]